MFGTIFKQMLELIDDDNVTVMQSPNGRVLVQVYGKSRHVHYIPPGKCICQCIGYLRGKKDYCKHILAAHFVLAVSPPDEYEEVSDMEITNIFKDHILKTVPKRY
jgi:hypothetical protein